MPTCSPYERRTLRVARGNGPTGETRPLNQQAKLASSASESVGALSLVGRLRQRSGAASAEALGGRCNHALGESSEEGDAEDAAEIGADPDQS